MALAIQLKKLDAYGTKPSASAQWSSALQHHAANIKREKEVQSGLQSQLQHALQVSSLPKADIAFLQRKSNDETKAAFQQAQVESRRQADIRRNREKQRKRPRVDQSPTHSGYSSRSNSPGRHRDRSRDRDRPNFREKTTNQDVRDIICEEFYRLTTKRSPQRNVFLGASLRMRALNNNDSYEYNARVKVATHERY